MGAPFEPIQLVPPGLLGLFQLKDNGRGIQSLPDVLQGVLELRDWYFQSRAEISQGTHGITVAAGTRGWTSFSPGIIEVPPREWWWVHTYTIITADIAAGDTVTFLPMYIPQATGSLRFLALGPANKNMGGTANRPVVLAQNFFLPPGSILGFWIEQHGAVGNTSFTGHLRFTRLPA